MEPADNIRFVCQKHRPKKMADATKIPLKKYVGKFVKVAFPAIDLQGKRTTEHMWLKVHSTEKGKLVGVLDNIPIFKTEVKYGDTVRVKRSEIEEMLND